MKTKWLLEFIQLLAFSIFVGIAGYGAVLYWGGKTHERIPVFSSLLLGFGAVVCIVIVVIIGGVLDRIAIAGGSECSPEPGGND